MTMNKEDSTDLREDWLTRQMPPEGEERPDASESLEDSGGAGVAPPRFEDQLKASIDRIQDRLVLVKGLVDGVDEGIVFVDATGKVLYANKRIREISGRGQDDMRGEPLGALNLVPAPAMPPVLSLLNSVLSGQTVQPFRVETNGKSGQTIPIEIHLSPLKKGEQTIGARLTTRNVTDQAREPEAGCGAEDRYRSLVENSVDWVWEVNERSVYTYVSASVRDILGYEPREVLGKSIFDLVPMAEANRVMKTLGATISARQPLKMVQLTNLRKDGRTVTLETNGAPVVNAAGQFSGYQGVHRDVTGRVQMDRRFGDDLVKVERTVEGIIEAMSLVVEMRDPHTAGHQKRVSQLGGAIAREMHNARARIPDIDRTVHTAALLHDLGKIFIPTEILIKPGQLTEDEFTAVKNHPRAGYDVLKKIDFPWPIADVVLQHHERLDGSGYPSGLRGDQIRVEASIIGVADVVEAMVHPRSYRPALSLDDALRELAKGKGVLFDREAVEGCLAAFLDRGFKFRTE
jgi:PAS domain S-box-containing protein